MPVKKSCVSYTNSDNVSVKRAIRRGKPIELYGLTFYPLTMEHFEEWQGLKAVLLLRMATLPARLAVLPYLAAIYTAETDYYKEHSKTIGLYSAVMRLLELALRLPAREDTPKQRGCIRQETSKDGEKLLRLHIKQDGNVFTITPQQFGRIRSLIAAQCGEKLPDEADNPELVEAEAEANARGSEDLILDLDDMLASVAVATGKSITEMDTMTIWEFNKTHRAVDRAKKFYLYGLAEANGGKIKGGNPCPSWCFDRQQGMKSLIDANQWQRDVGKGGGVKTVTPDALPSNLLM